MVELNKENLENALSGSDSKPSISKEEEIGFHKGAVNTLVNERNELIKMAGTVESLMQMHLKRLQELGVKISSK